MMLTLEFSIRQLILVFTLAISTMNANATNRSWVGSGAGGSGTDFNAASNWSPSGVPSSADNLTMTLTANGSCTVTADITINNLTVEVQGGSSWYFRLDGYLVTVNGFASFNALDYTSSSNYSYLEIDCDGSPGGFIFKGDTQLHTSGSGDTFITANSTAEGSMTFNGNLTIGDWAYTSPEVEPSWIFDGSGTQNVTFNSGYHFKPASFTFGVSNSPDVNFTNNNADENYFTVYDGNVSINNSADVYIHNLNFDNWTGIGNLYINDSGVLRIGSDSDFPGNFSSRTLSSTSTISYEGNLAQTVTALPNPGYGNLRIAGTNTKTSAASFDIRGDFISDGSWDDGNDTHVFDGTVNQDISGSVSPKFYNLTVNKSTGTLFIEVNTEVDNILTMSGGPIDLSNGSNGFDLEINNSSTGAISWSSGSGAYFLSEKTDISATVSWDINSTSGTHIIPFGNSSGVEIPLHITVTSGDVGTVSAATYSTDAANIPLPPSVTSVNGVSGNNADNTINRFWQIDKTGGGTTTVRFYYADADIPTNGEADLQPQRWNGSEWESHANSCPGGTTNDPVNNYGEGTGITSFSPWTLASFSSPLPVDLEAFVVDCEDKSNVVKWTTASELNSAYFEVERSRDGNQFFSIGKVNGSGNSSATIDYIFMDETPYFHMTYYRLRQVDFNGDYQYYGPVLAESCSSTDFNAFVSEGRLNLNTFVDEDQSIEIVLFDASGKHIATYRKTVISGYSSHELTDDLSSGLYFVRISSNSQEQKVIKIIYP